MSNKTNGGPAFPVPGLQHDEDFNGMTLRDYFAAGALANPYTQDDSSANAVATWAYAIADAMLDARKR